MRLSQPLWRKYSAIAVGGVLGASLRWAIADLVGPERGFRWSIFSVNVVGCFLLGLFLGKEARTNNHRIALQDFGAIGFCGGLTTMSTFALDVARLLNAGKAMTAVDYLLANVIVGLLMLLLGGSVSRRVGVLAVVERQP